MLTFNNDSIKNLKDKFESSVKSNEDFLLGVEFYGETNFKDQLKAPFSGCPCLYYRAMVELEYASQEEFTNQSGDRAKRWLEKKDLIFEYENFIPFELIDETGSLRIDIKGSEITPDKTYSSFDKGEVFTLSERFQKNNPLYDKLKLLHEEVINKEKDEGKSIRGYKFIEYTLPISQPLYVLGSLKKSGNDFILTKGTDGTLVVSVKSPNDVYEGIDQKIQFLFYGAVFSFITAFILFFYGITHLL